jgi:hypothetical protein
MLLYFLLVKNAKHVFNPTKGLINSIAVRWGAQVPDTGILGCAESEHDDTHHTHESRYSQHEQVASTQANT